MSTRAIAHLKRKKAAFTVVSYDPVEKGAEFAARAIGFALECTVKTLVVDLGAGRHVLVLLPGHRQASMKKIAAACDTKRAAMADMAAAERLTGYLVGGISPFGVRRPLPVLIEQSLLDWERVMINGGRRGIMLQMNPHDIVSCLRATAAPLIAP
jgi:Cys-tRNA(Pro)/Cys-tRNA(Cys) deacylase